jgi:hypothetical protein
MSGRCPSWFDDKIKLHHRCDWLGGTWFSEFSYAQFLAWAGHGRYDGLYANENLSRERRVLKAFKETTYLFSLRKKQADYYIKALWGDYCNYTDEYFSREEFYEATLETFKEWLCNGNYDGTAHLRINNAIKKGRKNDAEIKERWKNLSDYVNARFRKIKSLDRVVDMVARKCGHFHQTLSDATSGSNYCYDCDMMACGGEEN